MILRYILLILSIICFSDAVMIGTSKKHKADTLLLANYYINFQSDVIRTNDKDKYTDKFGFQEEIYIFKPVYYTENFLFHLTLPYRKVNQKITHENEMGIYDISAGIGYFIPNDYGDLLFLSTLQLPTGEYDENKPNGALQVAQDRYEIQEELYFFKAVKDTEIPFLIDALLAYHYRGENRDTKVDNGNYIGAEATISAILSPNFFIGPAVYYKKYNKEGLITLNVGSSKYQIGLDALYKFDDKNSLALEYVEDKEVKNRAEGDRFSLRYVVIF